MWDPIERAPIHLVLHQDAILTLHYLRPKHLKETAAEMMITGKNQPEHDEQMVCSVERRLSFRITCSDAFAQRYRKHLQTIVGQANKQQWLPM